MRISVVIPTRNRAGYLKEAIDSVLRQEPCGADIEIIVVDDGSTDDTREIVEKYPNAIFTELDHTGPGNSRNEGIRKSTGEWIAFLDDDDIWQPEKLKRSCEEIAAHPEARFVYSDAVICDAEMQPGPIWRGPDPDNEACPLIAFMDNVVGASVVMMHREVFEKAGLFDVSLTRAQDRDMWLRAVVNGFKCHVIHEPLVLYRSRPQLDGDLISRSYDFTMQVLRRYLTVGAPYQVPFGKRVSIMWHVRGWYAHELCMAARQERRKGEPARAKQFRSRALAISPFHTLVFPLKARGS